MKVIEPGYEILTPISKGAVDELKHIEKIARTCYKSEDRITESPESAYKMVKMLIDRGHEAMLEHSFLSVKIICDRGVSHELVRHRLASFAQESTRYCNYSNGKFGGLTCIMPAWVHDKDTYKNWCMQMEAAEDAYLTMIKAGCSAQEARAVLPNSLKTEICISANYREWRNILKLRTAPDAHPEMRKIMRALLDELVDRIPIVFDDIWENVRKK